MLIPISLSRTDNPRVPSYNLYNTKTKEVINVRKRDIRRALDNNQPVIGFIGYSHKSNALRLVSYFKNLGVVGEDNGDRHYTVVKRKEYLSDIRFVIVDKVGNDFELSKEELIEFISDGAIVCGVRMHGKQLRVSNEIEIEIIK